MNWPHLHLLTNHIPIFVTFSGVLILGWALVRKEQATLRPALLLLLLGIGGGLLTYWLGEQSYRPVRPIADEIGQEWLDLHMDRAEQLIWIHWLALSSTLAAAIATSKSLRVSCFLCWTACVFGAATVGTAAWIADAGGKIRHSEIRPKNPPAADASESAPHEH